jgi:hypothetical protein
MIFKGLGLVEEACPLLVLHWNCAINIAVYDPDSTPICLSTVSHKCLELGLRDTVLCHNIIQVLSKYTLNSIL